MKHAFKVLQVLMIVSTLMLTLSTAAHAGDKDGEMQLPPDNSSPELQRIKSLAGKWATESSMFGKKEKLYTEYEVTAGGSAVLERIFPGTPHEMVSVYYDDNGKLAMTHYCIMRNRPTLKLSSSTDDTISMRVAKIDGVKSKDDPAMGSVDIIFKDKNHITQVCHGQGKGKEQSEPMTMEYTRAGR